MGKIKVPQTLDNLKEFEDFRRFASLLFNQIVDTVNGNVDIVDNLRASLLSCNFPASGTEYQFNHGLNRIPRGYIVTKRNVALTVFDGNSANTKEFIYLQSSAVGTASVLVF